MKKLIVLFALLATCQVASAQILLSDFSSLGTQAFSPFNLTWSGGTPTADQYVQNSDNVSITAINGGNPDGEGSFDAVFAGSTTGSPTSTNFTGITNLQLTLRLDSGNADTAFTVEIRDSSFTEIGTATFLSSSFTSSFSTVTATFTLGGGGNVTDATYFSLFGDGISGDAVRVSLDNLQANESAAPEPSSLLLLGVGFAGLGLYYCRRSFRVLA